MKSRMFIVFVLVIGLAFILTWSVAAQGPEPPEPPPQPPPPWMWDGAKPFFHPAVSDDYGTQGVNAAVSSGQPGLTFRYVETLGVTETPYISDTTHINFPYGIAAGGTDIWIGESFGRRALKFTNAGSFVSSIGKAGFYRYQNQIVDWIGDVAVDNGGNVWVVDSDAHHVLKFDSNGNYVSKLGESWNAGSDNNHFDKSVGIAFDSAGNVYISVHYRTLLWLSGKNRGSAGSRGFFLTETTLAV